MEGSLLLYGFQFASSSKGTKAVSRSLISCFVLIAALRSHFQFVFLSFFFSSTNLIQGLRFAYCVQLILEICI